MATVRRWARAHSLKVVSVSPNRTLVRLRGSSTKVGRAFHTTFTSFRTARGSSFFGPNRAAKLPASFAGRVTSALGLSSLGRVSVPRPSRKALSPAAIKLLGTRLAASSVNLPASYGPQDFWSLYDAPSAQTGAGQHLAIVTEGDVSQPRKDLVTFEQHYGLPAVTWNQINVGTPSTDVSGADEFDLDSQDSTGFAPGVTQLDDYNAPSLANEDILAAVNRFVTDNSSRQASFSAGECELLAQVSGFAAPLDTALAQAQAQGQTMFFSSGDTGSQCAAVVGKNGVPAGVPGVEFPASSPHGIGVGGTTVVGPGPTEIAWYGSGGGASAFEAAPAFQSTAGGTFVGQRRGVPDVSLDADPTSGYVVYVDGQPETIGGTSASAPSWQGIWARVQGAHGGALGFAGPVLYSTEPRTAYHDIAIGTNTVFPAAPGYDYVTGLGTADIAKLVAGG